MLRVRVVIILVGAALFVYALMPAERKKRWIDKLNQLVRSVALAILLYWLYMLAALLWNWLASHPEAM